ncbi:MULTISPECIES: ParB/RepB/Spo0J family partition protein [Aurantimonadaceae]|uniref:ParB N-terminal domain-containing protein n=1 Tax=Jiella pelagia TaxID=2986949 RepID=A0ABY7C0B9_9HYPH|nr:MULTISPECIES: ParB N-terminal domain-containing protein [Aurantimonadaceae]MBC6714590.1 ParB N-terminal domain-containing protein [Aurantimonas sp. DM33-3]WAP68464.1 ParB N-terminal domain-containing protein [Jiella pelagia]
MPAIAGSLGKNGMEQTLENGQLASPDLPDEGSLVEGVDRFFRTQMIEVDDLHRRSDARPLNDEFVASLADSVRDQGLINPLLVRAVTDGYEIIAGSHRFAACDAVGMRSIPCCVVESEDAHAELRMIDENLVRNALTPSQQAEQLSRRKALYQQLFPETRLGEYRGNQHSSGVRQIGEHQNRFSVDASVKTGLSERTIDRAVQRGERIVEAAHHALQGTRLDRGSYLDELAKVEPDEQLQKVGRDLAALEESAVSRRKRKRVHGGNSAVLDGPASVYATLLAVADRIDEMDIGAVMESCPTSEKAAFCQRLRGMISRLSDIADKASL